MKNQKKDIIEEPKLEETLLTTVMFKPTIAYIICVIMGVLLIFTKFWMTAILGLALIGVAIFGLFFIKDRKVFEIFDQSINVFDMEGKTFFTVTLEEISQWACEKDNNGFECVKIALYNQDTIIRNTYFLGKVRKAFRKIMPEKEVNATKN